MCFRRFLTKGCDNHRLDRALASTQPLLTFQVTLDQVGGYREDPLCRKSLLLAMILHDRPETCLPMRDDE